MAIDRLGAPLNLGDKVSFSGEVLAIDDTLVVDGISYLQVALIDLEGLSYTILIGAWQVTKVP